MASPEEIADRFCRRAKKLRNIARNVADTDIKSGILVSAADSDRLAELVNQIKNAVA